MNNDEKEDIKTTISDLNLKYSDFEFKETDLTEYNNDSSVPILGEIEITYTPSKKSIKYKTGYGSSWPADFEFDLRTNAYGTR
jgi:hypothetical protein